MDKYLGEVVTVRYQVIGTYNSGDIIFLNSSHDYEADFTAGIFKDDEKYFQRRGIDSVGYYDGKTIEVTGNYRGMTDRRLFIGPKGEHHSRIQMVI